jgi:hypothetical protein
MINKLLDRSTTTMDKDIKSAHKLTLKKLAKQLMAP